MPKPSTSFFTHKAKSWPLQDDIETSRQVQNKNSLQRYTARKRCMKVYLMNDDCRTILWNLTISHWRLSPKLCRTQPDAILSHWGKLFPNWSYTYLCDFSVITGWLQEREITGDGGKEVRQYAAFILDSAQPYPHHQSTWRAQDLSLRMWRRYLNRISPVGTTSGTQSLQSLDRWILWMLSVFKYLESFAVQDPKSTSKHRFSQRN